MRPHETIVINCEHDVRRRIFMTNQLHKFKLPFRFWKACDGREMPAEEFTSENIFIEHPGGRGCALSHKKVFQYVATKPDDYVLLVLEDDALFHPDFGLVVPQLLENIDPAVGIVWLGYVCVVGHTDTDSLTDAWPLATHAYMITPRVARWVLNNFGRCEESIDLHLQNLYKSSIPRDWKSMIVWNGKTKSPLQVSDKNIKFHGFVYQLQSDAIEWAIHRN